LAPPDDEKDIFRSAGASGLILAIGIEVAQEKSREVNFIIQTDSINFIIGGVFVVSGNGR
jgi:hypothetical protein